MTEIYLLKTSYAEMSKNVTENAALYKTLAL